MDLIVCSPEALRFGGEVQSVTVLFTDVRDCTTFTERNDPREVVRTLREVTGKGETKAVVVYELVGGSSAVAQASNAAASAASSAPAPNRVTS